MSKYGIAFCIVVFIIMVSALFWGLEYFLNPEHESYVWDQYETETRSPDGTDRRVEYDRTPFGQQLRRLFLK